LIVANVLCLLLLSALVCAHALEAQTSPANPADARVWTAIQEGFSRERMGLPAVQSSALEYSPAALPKDAGLELSGYAWDPILKLWTFRLRCTEPGRCLPFLATMPGRAPVGGISGTYVARETRGKADGLAHSQKGGRKPVLIRAGEMGRVISEGANLRVSIPVVCLEAGAEDQWIRVRNPDTGRVFRARVRGDGSLAP
jgi:hypothetical protein